MRSRLVAVMLFVVAVGVQKSALGVAATPAEAQKQWKALAKEELAAFKTQVKVVLGDFNADVGLYKADLAAGTADPTQGNIASKDLYLSVYSGLESEIETLVAALETDSTNLLFGLGTNFLGGFMAGDGGTLDKTMASLKKEVDKFEKTMRKTAAAIKKAVEKNDGSKVVHFNFQIYPMPLGLAPTPQGVAIPVVEGVRINASLANFAVLRSDNFGFVSYVGISNVATVKTEISIGGSLVFTGSVPPNASGIYALAAGVGLNRGNYLLLSADTTTGAAQWSSFIGFGQ